MNKIYKIVKNRSTGLATVVSELARGATKGNKLKLFSLLALTIASNSLFAALSIPQDFSPGNTANKIIISNGSEVIDLGLGGGLSDIATGYNQEQSTIVVNDNASDLYQIKYVNVKNALNHFNAMQSQFDQGLIDQSTLNQAQTALEQAKDIAATISDNTFSIVDPNNLVGTSSETLKANTVEKKYRDPVTDKAFGINVVDELVVVETPSGVENGSITISFYEKMSNDKQYNNMNLIEVSGSDTEVTIANNSNKDPITGENNNQNNQTVNNRLTAISKNKTGIIQVNDGANLTFDTSISYYMGNDSLSTSKVFVEKSQYTSTSSTSISKVSYIGTVNTALGQRTINSSEDFNNFNQELIDYIMNNEQVRLDHPTQESMQAFYDAQIAGLYQLNTVGSYQVKSALTQSELEQLLKEQNLADKFNNRVTESDIATDVGLLSTNDNYFIGVNGSGSTITINQGQIISKANSSNDISTGPIIKANFDSSGIQGNNIFIINGMLDASGQQAVMAKNAEFYVGEKGYIYGSVNINGSGNNGDSIENIIQNAGIITGTISTENAAIVNKQNGYIGGIIGGNNVTVDNQENATVNTSITLGNNGTVTNQGTVAKNISVGSGSSIINSEGALVQGSVIVTNSDSTFTNNGTVGSVSVSEGSVASNSHLVIGSKELIKLSKEAVFNNTSDGKVYIGYAYNINNNNIETKGVNAQSYAGILLADSGTTFVNDGLINVASTQHDVKVISVSNSAKFISNSGSDIILNDQNQSITSVDKDTGNNNKAIYVDGSGSEAIINGSITLNDSGSTGVWVQNGGALTLNGTVNLNGKNVISDGQEYELRNFGAWVQGEGSTLIMDGNATINMNADGAIGVHVRDGAVAEISDHAGITFSDKKNQIGFLISGIVSSSSINYTSSQELKLNGEGAVLFRIERGSYFDSTSVDNGDRVSTLNANRTKNSTLMVITNGQMAEGSNNQTQADLSGFSLNVDGEDAKGISIEGGAYALITESTNIRLSGDDSILAKVDGWYYDLSGNHDSNYNGTSLLDSSAKLTTDLTSSNGQIVSGLNAIGYYITHNAILNHYGIIDFELPDQNNIGVKIDNGGELISAAGSYIKVFGVAVEISGSESVATVNNVGNGNAPVIWAVGSDNDDSAYHIKEQASLKLTGSGITRAEGTAHGILIDGASQIILDGATLDLYGDSTTYSVGNGIENRSSLSYITLTNNAQINVKDGYGIHSSVGFSQDQDIVTDGTINVYGQGYGIRFESIDLTTGAVLGTTDNSIDNSGYEKVIINVLESAGHGIYVDSSQDVNTSASVNIISHDGLSALEIKGTTQTASQSGNLYSANTNSTIIDLNNGSLTTFTNNGELLYGSFTENSLTGDYVLTALDKNIAKDSIAIQTSSTDNGLNFTNEINGKINGKVELLGASGNTITLRGEGNTFTTGSGDDIFIIDQAVGDDLGASNQIKQFTTIDGGDGYNQIIFSNSSDFTINNSDTIKNINYFALTDASKITLNNLSTEHGLNDGVAIYDITDADSVLTYKYTSSNTGFTSKLEGSGTFHVDLENTFSRNTINEFAFDDTMNTGSFTGTLELANTKYNLWDKNNNNNTTALTNSTLQLSNNSYVIVDENDQTIGGLNLKGGTVDFGIIDITNSKSANHIVVDNLLLDKGSIIIDASGSLYNLGIPTSSPILEQDTVLTSTKLISANHISGGAINIDIDRSQIKSFDENGNEITSLMLSNLVQNNETIARASYNTRLTKGENSDGLYIGYGLTQVELKVKNDENGNGNGLIFDATNSDPTKVTSSEFDALIVDYDNGNGTFTYGDLQIRGSAAVTLSGSNSYHGSTFVKDTSTLIANADSALGFSRLLSLEAGTKFDLNGWQQILGSIVAKDNAIIDLNGGSLTISGIDGTDSSTNLASFLTAGSLTGSGSLVIGNTITTMATSSPSSSIINITGDNTELVAAVNNATNGVINLYAQGGLGNNTLTNNGILNLYLSSASQLSNSTITGTGSLNKYQSGTLSFTLAQFENYTGVTNINDGAIVFSGDSSGDKYATSQINISRSSSLIGLANASFSGDINNSGQFYIGELPGSNTVSQHTVTVNNYTGNEGSHIYFNGTLTDDSSPINKLIIAGNSSGESLVSVNNIGGLGAKTINGIEIINVAGQSDANFIQSGRIMAGAYDYTLERSALNSNNWVLVNNHSVSPEPGSYLGNIFAANNLFNLRLNDRLGETQYTDRLTGEQKVTSMWMRQQYGFNKFKAGGGDLSIKDNWNITQIGGDIARWSSNGLNRLHVGLMAGHGRSKNHADSEQYSTRSDGQIDGYSFGLYATWYDNHIDKTGFYLDTWALWNNFNASVSGNNYSKNYRLKGETASLESGYSFITGALGNYDVWLQPKGQIVWQGVKTKDIIDSNGSRLRFNHGNLQTRLGIRASLLSNAKIQAMTDQAGQLFVEANWLHNTKLYNATFDDKTVGLDGARNIAELKVGIEGNIRANTNIWFNLAGQRGDHNYQNASIMLGLKYSF